MLYALLLPLYSSLLTRGRTSLAPAWLPQPIALTCRGRVTPLSPSRAVRDDGSAVPTCPHPPQPGPGTSAPGPGRPWNSLSKNTSFSSTGMEGANQRDLSTREGSSEDQNNNKSLAFVVEARFQPIYCPGRRLVCSPGRHGR